MKKYKIVDSTIMIVLITVIIWFVFSWVKAHGDELPVPPPYSPTPIDMLIINNDVDMDLVMMLMETAEEEIEATSNSIASIGRDLAAADELLSSMESVPSVPPDRFPPMPLILEDGSNSVGADSVYVAYVMAVEYQTNGVDGTIMEFQTVPVTNYVPRYPKLLYIQVMFSDTLNGEFKETGQEIAFKLGDTTNGFYKAELRIK